MSNDWERLKRSGNFKRKVRRNIERVVKSNISTTLIHSRPVQPSLVECHSLFVKEDFTSSMEELDNQSHQNIYDSSDDDENANIELTNITKNVELNKQIKTWATTFNITHSALKQLFKIVNNRIPNIFPKDPRTLLDTPRTIELILLLFCNVTLV